MSSDQAPINDSVAIRRILGSAEALLLDFDGPICAVFTGIPACRVASKLRTVLTAGGDIRLPSEIILTEDPFDVLSYAASVGKDQAGRVEAALEKFELESVTRAELIDGSLALMANCSALGLAIAIVSNNSASAVERFVNAKNIDRYVDVVSARNGSDVSVLKPNPYLVSSALHSLQVQASKSVLIGDSATDMVAGKLAGSSVFGFANKPGKFTTLRDAGADLVFTDMSHVARSVLV